MVGENMSIRTPRMAFVWNASLYSDVSPCCWRCRYQLEIRASKSATVVGYTPVVFASVYRISSPQASSVEMTKEVLWPPVEPVLSSILWASRSMEMPAAKAASLSIGELISASSSSSSSQLSASKSKSIGSTVGDTVSWPGLSLMVEATETPLPNTDGMVERVRKAPSINSSRLPITHFAGGMAVVSTVYSCCMMAVVASDRKILSPEATQALTSSLNLYWTARSCRWLGVNHTSNTPSPHI